jgi:3-isopropylmalate/(R)-2-methylmalate dehydratase small subunit
MGAFENVKSRMLVIPANNIDTDQIIPARFLKITDKAGLSEVLFYDWRYLPDGSPNPEFLLNRPEAKDARILVAGDNFGCGSSREHAPWALLSFGFRVVISTSFADIFCNNALKNGLLPVVVDRNVHQELIELAQNDGDALVVVDLESQTLTLPNGRSFAFPIDAFSKKCLLEGIDQLGYLMNYLDKTKVYEDSYPARVNTVGGHAG